MGKRLSKAYLHKPLTANTSMSLAPSFSKAFKVKTYGFHQKAETPNSMGKKHRSQVPDNKI